MKNKKILNVLMLGFMLMLFASQMVLAQQQGQVKYGKKAGVAELTTDELAVKITGAGQVPHFHFWDPNANDTDYHVMFLKIFEVEDNNDNGQYDPDGDTMVGKPLALPSSNWDMSNFKEDDDGSVHFNMTQTSTKMPSSSQVPDLTSDELYLQIRVHLYSADADELKFDLIMEGWNWNKDDSLLVFQFTISESSHGEEGNREPPSEVSQEGNEFQFGEGYMEYAEDAKAGNKSVNVRGTQGKKGEGDAEEEGTATYLAFDNFGDDKLVYDPTIGLGSADADVWDGGDSDGTTIGSPGMWLGFVLGGIAAFALIALKSRKERI